MVMPNTNAQTIAAAGARAAERRRATVVAAPAAADPELSERPRRRTFTAKEKLRILQEADQATGAGEIGALLRREGLYSSHLRACCRIRARNGIRAVLALNNL